MTAHYVYKKKTEYLNVTSLTIRVDDNKEVLNLSGAN